MPIDLPAYALTGIAAAPDLGIASAQSEGGLVVTSRQSDPFWRGRFTTRPLEGWQGNNEHADLLAFLINAADLNLRVDIVHPRHRYPSAYTEATWPMSGDGMLEDVTDLRTIVVSGLEGGLILRRGDRLSIVQDALIAHRWIAAGTTVASEIAQELTLTPRLPLGIFAEGASVVLENPKMRVMIVPGSWDATEAGNPTPISFDVMESLA